MKTNVRYKRPWTGEDANKLVITIGTAQHGTGRIAICSDELVRLQKLFDDHFEYEDHGRRRDYAEIRKATAQALADFIAQFLPNELKVKP